jgi:hypothetical protein
MLLSCIHCGQAFVVAPEQLGSQQTCPHCGRIVVLPEAEELAPADAAYLQEHDQTVRRKQWLTGSFSALTSAMVHMALISVIALVPPGNKNAPGEGHGEDVFLGALPGVQLTQSSKESFEALDAAEMIRQISAVEQFEEPLEMEAPASTSADSDFTYDLAVGSLSPSGGDTGGFELGSVVIGGSGAGGGGGNWEGMVQGLRRSGLDIVILFDSTGSMSGEIGEVKAQISRIGSILMRLIPKARISVCAYRDEGDEYVTKGIALTGDVSEVSRFLSLIEAGGGGDHPEAIHQGLQWAVNNNQFRPQARKVILLFGDAPPHRGKLQLCSALAGDFRREQKGVVSTVTCRGSAPLPEFYEIAQAGGGEAFLTRDERQIMTQLMVLVFGSQHREKVVEAFKLMER